MRHVILVIPTLALLACSSGGDGKPVNLPVGAFGVEGEGIPVFPGGGTTGGTNGGGQHDTGTVEGQDTGSGNQDTGSSSVDTGGGSSGDDVICAAKCPSDPETSASVISTCKSTMTGTTCPAEYRAYWTCLANNRVCTDTGTTDTTATQSACSSESMAISSCAG
jgi:hypothetical protein